MTLGEVVHITARGADRRPFAQDEVDRDEFTIQLAGVAEHYGLDVVAWCLMPNHYHLLLGVYEPPVEQAIRSLNARVARRYNRRHERSGQVFGRRYHTEHVDRDTHLIECVRYIVLNPVRAGLCTGPALWRWSSYRASAGLEPAPSWLAEKWLVDVFSADRNRFRAFVREGV